MAYLVLIELTLFTITAGIAYWVVRHLKQD